MIKVTRGEYKFQPLLIEISDAQLADLFILTLWEGVGRLRDEGERATMTATTQEINRVRNQA